MAPTSFLAVAFVNIDAKVLALAGWDKAIYNALGSCEEANCDSVCDHIIINLSDSLPHQDILSLFFFDMFGRIIGWRRSCNELSTEIGKWETEHEPLNGVSSNDPRRFNLAKSNGSLAIGATGDHQICVGRYSRFGRNLLVNLNSGIHTGTRWM